MNDLIVINDQTVNGTVVQTVNARELHAFLENGDKFATWIKDRIAKYDFVENQDFTTFSENTEKLGRPSVEYYLTLDMAKELSMVERNAKGKEARQYFIACEKKLRQMTLGEVVLANAQRLVQIEREQAAQADRLQRIEAKQQAFEEGFSYFTVLGFAAYRGVTIDLSTAQQLGKRAAHLSRERGVAIDRVKDPRFGMVNSYHENILNDVVAECL